MIMNNYLDYGRGHRVDRVPTEMNWLEHPPDPYLLTVTNLNKLQRHSECDASLFPIKRACFKYNSSRYH